MHEDALSAGQRRALLALSPIAKRGFYLETSLIYFDHAPLHSVELSLGIPVASLADIAARKIEAIASRGARKDFVDLYFICQEPGFDLAAALDAFQARFASANPGLLPCRRLGRRGPGPARCDPVPGRVSQ